MKQFRKLQKVLNKSGEKYLKHISIRQHINQYGSFQSIVKYKEKDLLLTSTYFANIFTRRTIVNLLKEINFVRKTNWTDRVVIAFMDEVINLFTFESDDIVIEQKSREISKRYNVPINRLKTQVALFITNLSRGRDRYNISSYFSLYEIILWKYRNIDKVQKDIENDKLTKLDKKLLRDLEIIEN